MTLKSQLNNLHLFLSRDIGAALRQDPQDDGYTWILFVAQLISIGSLFVTEDATGHLILIYILIPILLFPAKFSWVNYNRVKLPIPVKFSLYNIFRNAILCRTPLFLTVVLFGAVKSYLSYRYPEPVQGYLHIFFYYLLIPLIAFVVATVRLMVDIQNFTTYFFRWLTPVVALNGLYNLYLVEQKFPSLQEFLGTRFATQFGAALGYNPNLDAFIYVFFLIGLLTSLDKNPKRYNLFVALPSAVIFFITILITQSRASTLAGIFSLIVYAFTAKLTINPKIISAILVASTLCVLFMLFIHPIGLSSYFMRRDYLRPELWVKFFNIIREQSFIGLGDRTVFAVPLSDGELAPHPHNIFLSALLRGGLIGLACQIIILVLGLSRSYQFACLRQDYTPFTTFLMAMLAGLIDFDIKIWQAGWYLAGYWLVIALVVGADASLRNNERENYKMVDQTQHE